MLDAHNTEAEMSVIGAVLIDPEKVIPEILDIVQPQDFYVPMYAEFFRYAVAMTARGRKIDFVTMSEALKSKVGGDVSKELLKCADMVPSIANAKAHAEIIAADSRARQIQRALLEATSEPITAENVDAVSENVMSNLYEHCQNKRKKGLQPMTAVVMDWYSSLFKKRPDRVTTGFADLDYVLRGMYAGNLILLAARPAVGKSAFAAQIAKNVASTGKTVNFFSCEMETGEILERMASSESKIDMDILIDGSLTDKQNVSGTIASAADKLAKLPINICDDAGITVPQIRAQCRMTKNLGLIVVDYLQLLSSTHRAESRNVEVGQISRSLKILANDLKVPVLALSQLSRDIEKRGTKTPQMSDLRDSGSLEQDASEILFMYPLSEEENHKIIAVKVAKNRRGHTGEVQFSFDGSHMTHYPLRPEDYIQHKQYDSENPFARRR